MIKNKDGSYNKFRLLIISLIFMIAISITGFYIVENIELPKIDTPSWTTPTPTPTPTSIPIDPSIALLYNSSNITYDSNTTWNWTYTNLSTNVSNWTYPPDLIGNYTFIAGGGGSGGSGSSANISYAIVAGGGGGAGYTSVAHINSTPVAPVNEPTPQETLNASQVISPIIFPMMEMWWFPIIFIIPLIFLTTSIRSSTSIGVVGLVGLLTFGFFFNWGSMLFMVIAPIFMIIVVMNILRDTHDDYYDR